VKHAAVLKPRLRGKSADEGSTDRWSRSGRSPSGDGRSGDDSSRDSAGGGGGGGGDAGRRKKRRRKADKDELPEDRRKRRRRKVDDAGAGAAEARAASDGGGASAGASALVDARAEQPGVADVAGSESEGEEDEELAIASDAELGEGNAALHKLKRRKRRGDEEKDGGTHRRKKRRRQAGEAEGEGDGAAAEAREGAAPAPHAESDDEEASEVDAGAQDAGKPKKKKKRKHGKESKHRSLDAGLLAGGVPDKAADDVQLEPEALAVVRELVRGIYLQRNPGKLSEVDTLFDKYSGAELRMYYRICEKYGDRPEALDSIRARAAGGGAAAGVGKGFAKKACVPRPPASLQPAPARGAAVNGVQADGHPDWPFVGEAFSPNSESEPEPDLRFPPPGSWMTGWSGGKGGCGWPGGPGYPPLPVPYGCAGRPGFPLPYWPGGPPPGSFGVPPPFARGLPPPPPPPRAAGPPGGGSSDIYEGLAAPPVPADVGSAWAEAPAVGSAWADSGTGAESGSASASTSSKAAPGRPPSAGDDRPAERILVETFLGKWRDSMGHTVLVEWARTGNRGGQLDVELVRIGGGGGIRLNVKDAGGGHFTCGHYDLDVERSHSMKITWKDLRGPGKISVWERR